MIAPFPNCLSICAVTISRALSLSALDVVAMV